MSHAFVIEVGDEPAGLALADRDGYRFFSSGPRFDGLDGRIFPSARAAEAAAEQHLRTRKPSRWPR